MPAVSPAIPTTNTFSLGVNTAFLQAYEAQAQENQGLLANIMKLDQPSVRRTELYAYWEDAPHPRRVKRGVDAPREGFRARGFDVENLNYEITVDWHEDDEQDDQTRHLRDRAVEAGTNYGLLPERVALQIITAAAAPATTNPPMIATVMKAEDASRKGKVRNLVNLHPPG